MENIPSYRNSSRVFLLKIPSGKAFKWLYCKSLQNKKSYLTLLTISMCIPLEKQYYTSMESYSTQFLAFACLIKNRYFCDIKLRVCMTPQFLTKPTFSLACVAVRISRAGAFCLDFLFCWRRML